MSLPSARPKPTEKLLHSSENHPNGSHRPEEKPIVNRPGNNQQGHVQAFQDATNTHDAELISKTIDEIADPDALIRTPVPLEATGAQKLKEVFASLHRAFPDLHVTVEELIAEGDKVVGLNTVTGTHQGEYMGLPPTGKSVTYNEIFIFRFARGRIAETWGVVDVLTHMKQLGMVPA